MDMVLDMVGWVSVYRHYLVLNEQQEDMYIRLKEQEQNEQDTLYTLLCIFLYTSIYIILLYTLN